MAEAVTTPPAAATSTQKVKPEKPDDAAFKAKEAENERAFQKLKEQYVSLFPRQTYCVLFFSPTSTN